MVDTTLIAQIRGGDRDAAALLVQRYYDECWRYAYRMTGHRADAEDAVQDTFLRALKALDRYQERQRFRAWLFCILTNRCRTLLVRRRRALRRHSGRDLSLIPAEPPYDEDDGEPAMPPAQLSDALQRALGQLGSRAREAFLLKHAEGMDYAQMAEVTGVGVSALKMRVKRACDVLRPLLEESLHG